MKILKATLLVLLLLVLDLQFVLAIISLIEATKYIPALAIFIIACSISMGIILRIHRMLKVQHKH